MYHERILEIIMYILKELKRQKDLNDIDYKELIRFGYSDSEINAAIAWIYSKIQEDEKVFFKNISSPKSIRVLNPAEQRLFTPESLGYLISLKELGLISEQDFEFIIDKISTSAVFRVELSELKPIISAFVLNIDDPNDKRNRLIINNNDTIN